MSLFTILFLAAFSQAASPASAPATARNPASLSVDLDGDGTAESVTAALRGKKVRVEVRSGTSRKVLAEASPPVPADGAGEVSLSAGSLGSAGALLEVITQSPTQECRSIWRFRDQTLMRIPIGTPSAAVPECGKRGEWSSGWDRPREDAPAEYRRERTRETPDGPHHQVESFRYAGFRLESDPARSKSEVRGIAIPSWFRTTLYPKRFLEGLYARYGLTPLKKGPRLRFLTEPESGVFAVRFETPAGETGLPVTGREPGSKKNDVVLTLGSRTPPARARVTLASETVPGEVELSGLGRELDGIYTPAMRVAEGALRAFESAEDELAVNGLVGSWATEKGGVLAITLVSPNPALLEIAKSRYRVSFSRAPIGVDALLLPDDGSAPTTGLLLRGPNALARVPVRCDTGGACRTDGPAELLRRVGARLNAR
ncbi:MAG: hypothetical protein M3R34_01400 [Acidobacteriota bacterium]|nr:hypothetical protein [Acidobacteriota bacterium]